MNILDIDLGRKYWVSKSLSLRSYIGIRAASIAQGYQIHHDGGSWAEFDNGSFFQPAYNDKVILQNKFEGIGGRSGIEGDWNFGCGWSLFSQIAASILYGHFNVIHKEEVRLAQSPFSKQQVLDTKEAFWVSRAVFDWKLGIQYAALVCDCKYGLTARLSWEQHLFFHQNQMSRVVRTGVEEYSYGYYVPFPNDRGANTFYQNRGTLDTTGWTLTVQFTF